MKTATVSAETTAIHHTGRAWKLPGGVYQVVDIDIDRAVERGVACVTGTGGGALACVSLTDHRIDFKVAI